MIKDCVSSTVSVQRLFNLIDYKFSKARYFTFEGHRLEYFYHSYNNKRLTERCIEIAIVKHFLDTLEPSRILEVGNVTNHYYSYFATSFQNKIVVDKYEKGYGVINKDIKEYTSPASFDFIFSISTFEHLDSDLGRNPDYVQGGSRLSTYAADAIVHVCDNLLDRDGTFILTSPISYTQEFDRTIFGSEIYDNRILKVRSLRCVFMKRTGEIEWAQSTLEEAQKAVFGSPFPRVNVLVVMILKK